MQAGTKLLLYSPRNLRCALFQSRAAQARSINYDANASDVEALLHENLVMCCADPEPKAHFSWHCLIEKRFWHAAHP